VNGLFTDRNFWLLFKQLENDGLEDGDIVRLLETAGRDFETEKEEEDGEITGTVRFVFGCGQEHSLFLTLTMAGGEADKRLSLKENSSGKEYELGWWDLARAHPYCLRPQELDTLCKYWKGQGVWQDDLPYLLLCDFVGITEKKEGKALRSREREMLKSLRCYGRGLVSSVDEDGITREAGLKEEGYRWRQDPELGWLFSGSEYACYSLRNREHLGSECGTFPFAQWNAMIGGIR